MREIDTLIIHCSAVEYGNVELYKKWHLDRGWDDIGYHFVILNSYPKQDMWEYKTPNFESDGVLEIGRDVQICGAHTKNHNEKSIGICLVGDRSFSQNQYKTLLTLVKTLSSIYKIKIIKGHYEYDTGKAQGKTCPNIDMDYLRKIL